MLLSRRNFIKSSGLVSLGFVGLNNLAARMAMAAFQPEQTLSVGYGPLVTNAGSPLSLPKGFSCKIISQKGNSMADGLLSPGAHDGMGAFTWKNNRVLLIRNHELSPGTFGDGPYGVNKALLSKVDKSKIYDFGKGEQICLGGTTTMRFNEEKQQVELEYLSLTGTIRNCAGGITPWQSWLTCEETPLRKNELDGSLEKNHGYNFEVKATDKIKLNDPIPLKAMGRFVHEAVAVQPGTGIVYQTEDSPDSIFYRFLPNVYGELQKGGKLQCLSLKEWKSADTRNWPDLTTDKFPAKKQYTVEWLDLSDVEAKESPLRIRGFEQGAARFANTEGIWYGKNELFFACTSGGAITKGQIFRYVTSPYEGTAREKEIPGKLELFLEPNNTEIFQKCDNLTISPWGDVVICEDTSNPRIIGITPKGETYVLAKNVGFPKSEFAGPVFSPSGRTMFINIQSPGVTIAITGPWKERV
ncbi:phosphatase [Adhaeribacter arboris]|uniref:Phosphatase n=1 Tax=Adhaeribacter arboris TaxID=2072846 RepID=A0A2T2YID5_9BACT|nr:alkaline phosphatase PhoX [Adhaeribacter arboris]PSR55278.1 phosphatase [Adhaeribacter arboris]